MVNVLASIEQLVTSHIVSKFGRVPTHFEVVRGYNRALRTSDFLDTKERERIIRLAADNTASLIFENDTPEEVI